MEASFIGGCSPCHRTSHRQGIRHSIVTRLRLGERAPVGVVLGAAAGSAAADALKTLSRREASRVAEVVQLAAARVRENAERAGDGPKKTLNQRDAETLIEGVLIAARRSYEERKVPLIANLLATAPFTGTPVENMISTLAFLERLTYRQLCILAVIQPYDPPPLPELSGETIGDLYQKAQRSEHNQGVLVDLMDLMAQGLAAVADHGVIREQVPRGQARPRQLRLTYPGLLLFNGARLLTIPEQDLDEVRAVLGRSAKS